MTIDVGKVGMVPTDSILIDGRTREIMGDLDATEENMRQIGLTTPLTVKDNLDGTYRLLAGERRLTILKRNNNPVVPVRIYDRELSVLEIKIIEKSENFFRKDFEYWEYDKLVLDITRLEQELQGVKAPGPGQSGHSLADTGEMLGVSKTVVSLAIKRAELRESCPELFEDCKTAADATNVIKKMDEALLKHVIAQKLESKTDNKALIQLSKSFILRDFFEGVKEIPAGVFHLVEIDPPYAIDLAKQKKKDGESQYLLTDYNEIPSESYQEFLSKVFKECYRVMAEHSWLICWFAPEPWFDTVYQELNKAGLSTSRMCGIWTKGVPGQNMNPSTRLSNSYEMFFYAWKGQPALNKAGRGNQFHFSPIPAQQKTHPTERPIELTNEIYDTFAFSGSRVLIPFLGSGNGLISAHQLGMTGIGFEIGKGYKDSFLVKVHNMKGV